ncbi:MAG: hypothetical protein IKU37_01175 [Candidatus Gastranaerophilales bacterium]|nr:hypothetical protein [Candidatus Gastranaerophilales bacterium]
MRERIIEMQKEIKSIKKESESLAMEMIKDNNKTKRTMAIAFSCAIIIMSISFFVAICMFLKYIKETGVEETIATTKTQEIQDVDSIDNSNIVNGDMNGKNQAKNNNSKKKKKS